MAWRGGDVVALAEPFVETLRRCHGNTSKAAESLGLTRRSMGLRMRKFNLTFRQFRTDG